MFQPPSKEALAALFCGDAGFQEYLTTLPETERALVDRVFESPELLDNLIALLPPDQQLVTRSLLNNFKDIPERAMLCTISTASWSSVTCWNVQFLCMKSMGLPLDAIIKNADFVVQKQCMDSDAITFVCQEIPMLSL